MAQSDDLFARDRNVSVRERPRPDYEAAGVHVGSFTVFPKVHAEVDYSDNIYAASTNEASDTTLLVHPEVVLQSNWTVHSLELRAQGDISRFADHNLEDEENYLVGGTGRFDIRRGSFLTLTADHARNSEPRTSPNSPAAAAEPTTYYQDTVGLTGTHQLNRIRLVGGVVWTRYNYDNVSSLAGGTIRQDDRDFAETDFQGRVEYAVSPDTSIFIRGLWNTRDYREVPPVAVFDRTSKGYEASVGADFDLTSLIRGQAEVGYLRQDYDDPRTPSVDGLLARGRLEWFVTQLTTLTFTVGRAVNETTLFPASGYLSTTVTAAVDHELRRNIILMGSLGFDRDDYTGLDRQDNRVMAMIGASYLMNRNIGLNLAYNYTDQTSKGVGGDGGFRINALTIGLTYQY